MVEFMYRGVHYADQQEIDLSFPVAVNDYIAVRLNTQKGKFVIEDTVKKARKNRKLGSLFVGFLTAMLATVLCFIIKDDEMLARFAAKGIPVAAAVLGILLMVFMLYVFVRDTVIRIMMKNSVGYAKISSRCVCCFEDTKEDEDGNEQTLYYPILEYYVNNRPCYCVGRFRKTGDSGWSEPLYVRIRDGKASEIPKFMLLEFLILEAIGFLLVYVGIRFLFFGTLY